MVKPPLRTKSIWPKDPATGKNQDCCHIVPKADGGAHNVNNVEPLHIRYGNA
jgi:hypothetical protein